MPVILERSGCSRDNLMPFLLPFGNARAWEESGKKEDAIKGLPNKHTRIALQTHLDGSREKEEGPFGLNVALVLQKTATKGRALEREIEHTH